MTDKESLLKVKGCLEGILDENPMLCYDGVLYSILNKTEEALTELNKVIDKEDV